MEDVKIKLVLGGMGHGKTTLMAGLRKKGLEGAFDSDDCRVSATDGILKERRERAVSAAPRDIERRWRDHNSLWFLQIWGAIGLMSRLTNGTVTVSDHGGWFILDKMFRVDVRKTVVKVVAVRVPLAVALLRVKERGDEASSQNLAAVSWHSYQRVLGLWAKMGVPFVEVDGTASRDAVLSRVFEEIR